MEATGCGHVLGFDQDFAAADFTLWRRGCDNVAIRGQRHRQIPAVQGEPTGPM